MGEGSLVTQLSVFLVLCAFIRKDETNVMSQMLSDTCHSGEENRADGK